MPSSSYIDYCAVMLALPGTGQEVADRCNMTTRGAMNLLRRFWTLKLVHPGDVRIIGPRNTSEAIWMAGEGEADSRARVKAVKRAYANHFAFAALWRCLQDGETRLGLAEETGVAPVSALRVIQYLRARKQVYIAGWQRDTQNRPYPIWMLGTEKNAKKPAPMTPGEKCRRYRQGKKFKTLTKLGCTMRAPSVFDLAAAMGAA